MKSSFIIFLFIYSVYGYNDTIEKKQPGSAGVPSGDLMLQRISTSFEWINHLFWLENEKNLFAVDKMADKLHRWNYDEGKVITRYLEAISGEYFSFGMPLQNENKMGIIASDQKIRIINFDNDRKKFNISEPVIELNDKGYAFHTGHCDKEGTLYFISNYRLKCKDSTKGGILYKIKDKKVEKVEQFRTKVADFVFSHDYKKMFIILDAGKIIVQYDFDMQNGAISNQKLIFNVTEVDKGADCSMTSIEIDNKGNLWVSTDNSLVIRIDNNGHVTKIVLLPLGFLTTLTFGGYQNKNLMVGSKQECSQELQAGSIIAITGLNTKGIADVPFKWK